jgi:hypothetical protein
MATHVHILHALRIFQAAPIETVNLDTPLGYLIRVRAWVIPGLLIDGVEAEELVDKLRKRATRLHESCDGDNPKRQQPMREIHDLLSAYMEISKQRVVNHKALYHDLR